MGKIIHQTNTESQETLAKQMRPIALTDVSYKLFMTIIGKKIDRHILENNKRMETQDVFLQLVV